MSQIGVSLENWPVTFEYITRAVGEHWEPDFQGKPLNFEDACLAIMPRTIYERFVKGYSEKQWGVPALQLSASLAGRFEVRTNGDRRLKPDLHQGLPLGGYQTFTQNIIKGIPALLNQDYLQDRHAFRAGKLLVFTGPIDEFFGYEHGRLSYRAQHRTHEWHPTARFLFPCGQVNNPDPANGAHVRTLEWKHMMPPDIANTISGTVITRETPVSPAESDQYEYPFPDLKNQSIYKEYRRLAGTLDRVLICGRLGEYRYLDMDQAIARAMQLARRFL
jgi:UDP-galactopyranose mutase